jgi:tetratricopeptide (TPR) repeat protein
MELKHALYHYCDRPFDGKTNFDLAYCYENQEQLASAFGYYLRASQHSTDSLLIYESLLRAAFCFEQQGSRPFSTKHLFEYAIGANPQRPEAYFHICRFLEWSNEWAQILLFSSIGMTMTIDAVEPSLTDLNYPGTYALKFYKALSLYHLGDAETSLKLFAELNNDKKVNETYAKLIANNVSYVSTVKPKNYVRA